MTSLHSANTNPPDDSRPAAPAPAKTRASAVVAKVEQAAVNTLDPQTISLRPLATAESAAWRQGMGLAAPVAARAHQILQTGAATAGGTTSGGGGMAGESSIRYQLELLESLQRYLHQVQGDLEGMADQYAQQLNQLGQAGMTEERLLHYQSTVFEETRREFVRLIERLQMVDHAKVRDYQAWLEAERDKY